MTTVQVGSRGQDALNVQCALAAAGFYSGDLDGDFGPHTQAAVIAFQQQQNGLRTDGVVDAATAAALGIEDSPPVSCKITGVTVEMVSQMFPGTPVANIQANLPYVLNALADAGLGDRQMVLMALATIRAETACFLPISEGISPDNTTPPGDQPFDKYDKKLGNQGHPDGSNFRGRGFIQLTGRSNFQVHSAAIGLGDALIQHPTQAHDQTIAAKLMASYLKLNEPRIRTALAANKLDEARQAVNGGINGLPQFEDAYNIGLRVLPPDPLLASSTNA